MTNQERDTLLSAFGTGQATDAYRLLGCHDEGDGRHSFRVWAPDARAVSVVGDFNGWVKYINSPERCKKHNYLEKIFSLLLDFLRKV